MGAIEKQAVTVLLNDPKGLHERVAIHITKLGKRYGDTTLHLEPPGQSPIEIGRSILNLLLLGMPFGSQFRFLAEGPHAQEVIRDIFNLKLGGPVFLPDGSTPSAPELKPTVTPEIIEAAAGKKGEPPAETYRRIKTEIGDAHESLFFMDFSATSPGAMIDEIKRILQADPDPDEYIPAFIDYVHRVGIFGKNASVRHGDLTEILTRHFRINFAPSSLTSTSISMWNHPDIVDKVPSEVADDSLLLSFLKSSAMEGLLTFFGRHAGWHADPDPAFIELLPNPDRHIDREGGSTPPRTGFGSSGGPVAPPTSISGVSTSPFIAGGRMMFARPTPINPAFGLGCLAAPVMRI